MKLSQLIISPVVLWTLTTGNVTAAITAIYAPDASPTTNAFFESATGNGSSQNVIDWQQFKTDVEAAALVDRGGVIDFEDSSDIQTSTVIGPIENNILGFEINGEGFGRRTLASLADQNGPFPSGTHVLSRNQFSFNSFDFSPPNLYLTQAGFTIIGDRFDNISQAEITASFSGGGSVTLDSSLRQATDRVRIFYGFKAPPGEAITSINSNFGASRVVILDDFGFIAVPEPNSILMLGLGLCFALRRRAR